MSTRDYTELEELQTTYSDFHKELYGFRPRPPEECWNSVPFLEAAIDALSADAPRVAAEEAAQEQAAIERFEERVRFAAAVGAKTREVAIRWLVQAEDDPVGCARDPDYFCYCHGLPYGYLKGVDLTPLLQEVA